MSYTVEPPINDHPEWAEELVIAYGDRTNGFSSKDDEHIYFLEENVDVISIYEMCNSMLPLWSGTTHLLIRNYINILFPIPQGLLHLYVDLCTTLLTFKTFFLFPK